MNQQISNFAGEVKYSWNGFDINSVLSAIKHYPGLFISPYSISSLWNYLYGYTSALRMCEKVESSYPNYYHFGDWYQGKLNYEFRNNGGWCHNILENNNGDEEKSLVNFFEYYDEFSKSKPLCYQIKITAKHKQFAENESVIKRFKSTQDYEQDNSVIVPETVLVFQLPQSKTHWFVYINSDGYSEYENVEMNFEKVKARIDKEFNTQEKDWNTLNSEESYDLYNMIFITKEIPTETRFITVTSEKF